MKKLLLLVIAVFSCVTACTYTEPVMAEMTGDLDLKWIIYVIGGLATLLFALRKITEVFRLSGPVYVVFIVLFLLLCAAEVTYIATVDDFWWFMKGLKWYFKLLVYAVYALLLYNQLMSYMKLMIDTEYHSGADYNFNIGIYGCIIYVVGIIIVQSITGRHDSVYENYVIATTLVIFLIQSIIILYNVVPEKGWKTALPIVILYFVTTICTAVMSLVSVYVLAVSYILFHLAKGSIEEMERSSRSSSRSRSASVPYSGAGGDEEERRHANRNQYDNHRQSAEEFLSESRYYERMANEAMRDANTYSSYAEDYAKRGAEHNDESELRYAADYASKAEQYYSDAEDYARKADEYYRMYEREREEAQRYDK